MDERRAVSGGNTLLSDLHRLLQDEEVAGSNPVARPLSPDRQNGPGQSVIDQTVVVWWTG